jgi:NADPH:quinone reductase-like Zn-dependent oxidoreductase
LALASKFGMMAEYACAAVVRVYAIPDSMSFEDAAALPLNYATAYQILFDMGHLSEGESVLVQMAGGGVVRRFMVIQMIYLVVVTIIIFLLLFNVAV